MRIIYLDYNATTPTAREVASAMSPFLETHFGNPSSTHSLGRACREAIEDARARVAQLIKSRPEEIIFTGGGTEANNLAIKGVAMRPGSRRGGHLVTTAIEHPAVLRPIEYLTRCGFESTVVAVGQDGTVDPGAVEESLSDDTILVSVMLANNEIGTVQPVREIAECCHRRGILVHCDAAQAIGKISTRVDELGVDMMSIAGHKFYAPKGVGALYLRQGLDLEPVLHGAGHEGGLRAGTENTASIVGLGQACQLVAEQLDEMTTAMRRQRDRLHAQLSDSVGSALSVNGAAAPRLPNTLSVNFPNVDASQLLQSIPELSASTGAACHSDAARPSDTLAAIGLPVEVARGTVRLSVGWHTTDDEIARAATMLIGAWERLAG